MNFSDIGVSFMLDSPYFEHMVKPLIISVNTEIKQCFETFSKLQQMLRRYPYAGRMDESQ